MQTEPSITTNSAALIAPGGAGTVSINDNQLMLPLPAGVRFTSRRLEMPEILTRSDLYSIGLFLNKSGDSLDFWRSDFIERCRKDIGDADTKDLLRQLEFENKDFAKAQLLASIPVRDADLTPEHHFVLARACNDRDKPTPDIWKKLTPLDKSVWESEWRMQWAETAKREKLSPAELQESIKKGTVTRITPNTGSGAGGVTTWGGIRMQFDLIRRRIGDGYKTWPLEDVDATLKDLNGITSFVVALQFRRRELLKAPAVIDVESAA